MHYPDCRVWHQARHFFIFHPKKLATKSKNTRHQKLQNQSPPAKKKCKASRHSPKKSKASRNSPKKSKAPRFRRQKTGATFFIALINVFNIEPAKLFWRVQKFLAKYRRYAWKTSPIMPNIDEIYFVLRLARRFLLEIFDEQKNSRRFSRPYAPYSAVWCTTRCEW